MSGGERKRRSQRGQCWEEAGSEFYQESYPADVDMEALQRDPTKINTMLPSKQVSRTACVPTQSRRQSIRRRASTRSRRHSTVTTRRGSTANEVHLASLPDLTDESIPNEEKTWEEIMRIKAMPVAMGVKREQKAKLKNGLKLRLQGIEAWKWQRRKALDKFRIRFREFLRNFELWHHSLKKIEGTNGTGVVSYFLFIKWLMYLNLSVCILIVLFIILPDVLSENNNTIYTWLAEPCGWMNGSTNGSHGNISVDCCSSEYFQRDNQSVRLEGDKILDWLQDLVQGTGWMERTLMFYGHYSHQTFEFHRSLPIYNFPLAYLLVLMIFFLVSLIAMVRSTARGFKESILEREGHFYQYCNLVFGGWDFCISGAKAAQFKHKALYNEIKGNLEAERMEEERQGRTRIEKLKLGLSRMVANVIILCILAAAAAAIYYTAVFSRDQLSDSDSAVSESKPDPTRQVRIFVLEFLPLFTITALNLVIPTLFQYIVTFEKYSPSFEIKITLIRTVFLRLANLAVLVGSIYDKLGPSDVDLCFKQKSKLWCWETHVGQQMYKLAILDFVTVVVMTFFVDFCRMLVGRKASSRLAKFLSNQEFDLPKNTLDVVYGQTLCWFGAFYAPLLPLLTAIKCFLLFYVKKFACLVNSTPTCKVYRASRSSSMFMVVLLLSFLVAVLPVGYSIAQMEPSRACGPFRGLSLVWSQVVHAISLWPSWLSSALFFLGTAGFAVPVLIVLLVGVYYFHAVAAANKHMVVVLKSQLVLEGHDKQFLLNRLNLLIRKHQERMQQRGGDMAPPGTSNNYDD